MNRRLERERKREREKERFSRVFISSHKSVHSFTVYQKRTTKLNHAIQQLNQEIMS